MSDFEDQMKQQIGSMGDPEAQERQELARAADNLGKLQHVPGQKEELSESEQDALDKFKTATLKLHNDNVRSAGNDIRDGWIPIDRSEMGIRSQFYPQDWEFRVKPASVEAIKNWSSIDEENLGSVHNVMNEIVRTCVSIYSEISGKQSWDKINSHDRMWFVLKVREYTFKNGEQALEFDEECDNCGCNLHYTLESKNLYYEFPDLDIIEKHWNQDKRCWEIDPKEYDVDAPVVKFYVPTLQKDNAILQWMFAQDQAGKTPNETFIKFLPYMLERAPKDPSLLDKAIRDCQQTYKRWDTETFLFLDDVRRNIALSASEKLITKCPDCGEEVASTVRFPNGVKYLFAIQSKHRKFGSK